MRKFELHKLGGRLEPVGLIQQRRGRRRHVEHDRHRHGPGDLGIVNHPLTLEYLESQFYDKVVASHLFGKGRSVGLSGEVQSLAKLFGAEEAEHVSALTKAISASGGTPVKKPTSSSRSPARPASSSSPTRCSPAPGSPRTGRLTSR